MGFKHTTGLYWEWEFDYCDNCHNKDNEDSRYVLAHCTRNDCKKSDNGECAHCGTKYGDGLKTVEYYIGLIAYYLEIIPKWP
jgi:hypothetical protein